MAQNYYQLGRKLSVKYPDFAKHLTNSDNIPENLETFIPALYSKFILLRPEKASRNEKNRNRMEFIAIVVKHFDPEALTMDKSLKKGIRTHLATQFNCGSSLISHTLKTVKNYLIIYKEFKISVEYIYQELFEK